MTMIQFLGEWMVRSSVLILTGTLLLWLLRVKNPSVRLAAWTAMLAGSLAIPLLTAALPNVPLPVMRAPAAASGLTGERGAILPMTQIPGLTSTSAPPRSLEANTFDWIRLAAILYALGAIALLLRLFGGLAVSRRILRRSRSTGFAAAGIEVRESDRVASPVTIGVLRPAILLPPDWREWDAAKLDAVLAHERSHIRRRDPEVQFVSAIHRALLWASPLSWFLDRSIVRAAELISDDDAVAAIRDRVSYAEILLEFVQRGASQSNSWGVSMARYDRPEKRIRRILNSTATPRALTRWGVVAILGLGAPLAYLAAAAHPQGASRPDPLAATTARFEIASVKPIDPNVPHNVGAHVYPGGRVVLSGFNLKTIVATAFGLSYWQISGGDEWTGHDIYTVEAKPSEAMRSSIKDLRHTLFGVEDKHLREMLQALLVDRFQLKFHRETKTGDVYLLERSGKTLRLRATEIPSADADPAADHSSFGSIGYAGGQWNISATSMPQLAKFASDFIMHVPVLDRTELSGSYDYRQRQPDLEPKYSGDQSETFLRYVAELGLKLEHAKGPVEVFVIDHAAKPSSN